MAALSNLRDFFFSQAQIDILWFQISVDYLADTMQVIQSNQALFGHDSNQWHWHTFVVVAFNYFEKIYAQNLEDHDKMFAVRAMMQEAVQKLNTIAVLSCDFL